MKIISKDSPVSTDSAALLITVDPPPLIWASCTTLSIHGRGAGRGAGPRVMQARHSVWWGVLYTAGGPLWPGSIDTVAEATGGKKM